MSDMTKTDPFGGQLVVPVHFVCPEDLIWPELRGGEVPMIAPERISKLYRGINDSWIQRTYYQLARAGQNVTLSGQLRNGVINVTAVDTFGYRARKIRPFVVSIRADFHDSLLANFLIEQNFLNQGMPNRAGIVHWPEAGIIPRDPARGDRIERVVFKGEHYNLAPGFRDEEFLAALKRMGMELVIDARNPQTGDQKWNDYNDVDVTLAVRNLTAPDATKKPASKLVNAWIGGTAALLGPEPAFQELRRSELDFFEVCRPADAIEALARLQSDTGLFRAVLRNAQERAQEFSAPRMVASWLKILNGPVLDTFRDWERRPLAAKAAYVFLGMLREPASKKRHKQDIETGPRILGS